ncbi:MAG: hypothetical protein ABJ004_17650 [Cyclobacteriaceae bacterium]
MKRVGSILLLILFLAIHVGHLGYYWYGLKKIDNQWLEHVEVHSELTHITVPVTLPYWNTQSEYKSTYGSITIEGKKYRKVYQKYDSNGLHLLLAEDYRTLALKQSISDWIQMTTDTESSSGNSTSDLIKTLSKEYTSLYLICFESKLRELTSGYGASFQQVALLDGFELISTPPPRS